MPKVCAPDMIGFEEILGFGFTAALVADHRFQTTLVPQWTSARPILPSNEGGPTSATRPIPSVILVDGAEYRQRIAGSRPRVIVRVPLPQAMSQHATCRRLMEMSGEYFLDSPLPDLPRRFPETGFTIRPLTDEPGLTLVILDKLQSSINKSRALVLRQKGTGPS